VALVDPLAEDINFLGEMVDARGEGCLADTAGKKTDLLKRVELDFDTIRMVAKRTIENLCELRWRLLGRNFSTLLLCHFV
jgi:hypothetical protein